MSNNSTDLLVQCRDYYLRKASTEDNLTIKFHYQTQAAILDREIQARKGIDKK